MTAFVEPLKECVENSEYLKRCQLLQQAYQDYIKLSDTVEIKKDHSNLFRHRQSRNSKLDMRQFCHVLSLDQTRQLVEVEGLVTYAALVSATLKQGFLPTVVPELKSITVGGALTGIGIESSSFRFGLVHETIVEFDVLLASGEIVTCRPDNEYADLFFSFPNSYGTLGYALRIVLRVIPAKANVELTHKHYNQPSYYFEALIKLCEEQHEQGALDFIEGVAFGENDLIISTAQLVNEVPYVHNYKHMNIYYKSLQNRQKDFLTASDYIWRWDTDWFWCSKVFGVQNKLIRFFVGKHFLRSTMYRKIMHLMHKNKLIRWVMQRLSKRSESVIQDVAIPSDNALCFFEFFVEHIPLRPFWMCPTKSFQGARYPFFDLDPDKLYINFGFWGTVPSDQPQGYYNRMIEAKVVELGGIKSLYSDAYYSKAEFWEIFDKSQYDIVKKRYDPMGRFKDLYAKVVGSKTM